MRMILFALLAVGVGACGTVGEEDRGGLNFEVRAMSADSVIVSWEGAEERTQGESGSIVLDAHTSGGYWEGKAERLITGDYVAVATGFVGGELAFESRPTPFTVKKTPLARITIWLNELHAGSEFTAPYFESLTLDRDLVEQYETLLSEVRAAGGEGTLSLSGRTVPKPLVGGGSFSGGGPMDLRSGGGYEGSIAWTPPQEAGEASFILQVGDTIGNLAELQVYVEVGPDRSDAEFQVHLNMAPTVSIRSELLKFGDEGTLKLFVTVHDDSVIPGDPNTDRVNHSWSSSCQLFLWTTGPLQLGVEHIIERGVYLPAQPDDCAVSLTVTDHLGATRVHTLHLRLDQLLPEILTED